MPGCAGTVYAGPSGETEEIVPGRYIVVLNERAAQDSGEAKEEADEDKAEYSGLDVKQVYGEALKGYSAEIPEDAVRALKQDPDIKSVVPDRVDRAFS